MWCQAGVTLLDNCFVVPEQAIQNSKVNEWTDRYGAWDLERMRKYLPPASLDRFINLLPPKDIYGCDKRVWGLSASGDFD